MRLQFVTRSVNRLFIFLLRLAWVGIKRIFSKVLTRLPVPMSLFATLFGRRAAEARKPRPPAGAPRPDSRAETRADPRAAARAAQEPEPAAALTDAEILSGLNALAADALASGRVDKARAARLAQAARGRWTDAEFAGAVRQAADRQMRMMRAREREAAPLDPLAARAAAGYRASSSFSL
ncbi:hypothetical protein [Frigidibacter sp. MR17.24]|uniref:hypothetical protein n=1 Tax=Frigidibacter sp. MR17.24 TaxID=3127345 RepID=UPI003012A151